MLPKTKVATVATLIALPIIGASTLAASAYSIDCAILLCLAGGWPASTECRVAKAEFIRRITPFPIEPPLQIWRCPMGASYQIPTPSERLWSIAKVEVPQTQVAEAQQKMRNLAIKIASGPTADVDISDPTYNFVRSVRVFQIDWEHRTVNSSGGQECARRKSRAMIGTYGQQGDFSWDNIRDPNSTPEWLGFRVQDDGVCQQKGRYRGVGVEWTDYFGEHGFEIVRY